MWPPISSFRMSFAYSAASSALSANFTPPAFMRPPVRTWDLITVGPPIRCAISRACWSVVAKPKSVTGMPARLTISRASYSKKRMAARNPIEPRSRSRPAAPASSTALKGTDLPLVHTTDAPDSRRDPLSARRRRRRGARPVSRLRARRLQLVGLGELRILAGEHLREVHHHLALLPGGVVLHLPVDHVDAAAVRDRLDHLLGELDLVRVGGEDPLGDLDLGWVQGPRPDAAEQEGRTELRLAPLGVPDVAVGSVERQDAGARAGVDHASDRVVPGVLLGGRARRLRIVGVRVLDHAVAGVAAAHARGLHAPVRGKIRRPEAHSLHARACGGDLLEVGHALSRLEDRVDEDRAAEPGLRLQLRQQAIHVVDVPRALDLRHHHYVEPVADGSHQLHQVVEHPGALERVDARPELRLPELYLGT